MTATKIVVLDDDPTGSQTVHSCLLLTRWDVATLRAGLADEAPLFFVLTNTRGMGAAAAADLTREVCRNLKQALAEERQAGHDINPILGSGSESELRRRYPDRLIAPLKSAEPPTGMLGEPAPAHAVAPRLDRQPADLGQQVSLVGGMHQGAVAGAQEP